MNQYNLDTYKNSRVVDWYNRLEGLTPAEAAQFNTVDLGTAVVLDIGIGGGRTTAALLAQCSRYTGIDYSESFVHSVRRKYPAADLRTVDARDLSAFSNASFDLVNFSFNGIDYVDLEGRNAIFAEVARVLKPGGQFFFSTHNRSHPGFNRPPWTAGHLHWTTRLKTFLKLLPWQLRHLRNKRQNIDHGTYAIINDSAHSYSLLTFYTSPQFLRDQLIAHGFSDLHFLNGNGHEVSDDKLDDWIIVTCRKNAGARRDGTR